MDYFTDGVRVFVFLLLIKFPHLNTNGLRIKPVIYIAFGRYLTTLSSIWTKSFHQVLTYGGSQKAK